MFAPTRSSLDTSTISTQLAGFVTHPERFLVHWLNLVPGAARRAGAASRTALAVVARMKDCSSNRQAGRLRRRPGFIARMRR
jgi:hypothetical protein